MDSSILLSRDEIDAISKTCEEAGATEPKDERRTSDRSAYPAYQPLAPYGEWGLPKRHMFCEVRCHDISCGGISFFLARPPAFRFAVIGLGKSPNLNYFLIRAIHCVEYTGEKKEYLVGCCFLQRVKSPE